MSVVIETLVCCDGCGENYGGDTRALSASYIREQRKRIGWKQIGSKDYCPECVAARKHLQPINEKETG